MHLRPHQQAARAGSEAVQVAGIQADAQRHGVEGDFLGDHLVAEADPFVVADRVVQAHAVAEEDDGPLPAQAVFKGIDDLLHAGLQIGVAEGHILLEELDGFLNRGRARRLEAARSGHGWRPGC